MEKESNGMAIAGFVCSLCGLLTCGVTSIIGIILSIIGLKKANGNSTSRGLAIMGIIIGSLVIISLILATIFITVFSVY